ncbi:hypothetical protein PAMP_004299 [Pampus punctatissimus]
MTKEIRELKNDITALNTSFKQEFANFKEEVYNKLKANKDELQDQKKSLNEAQTRIEELEAYNLEAKDALLTTRRVQKKLQDKLTNLEGRGTGMIEEARCYRKHCSGVSVLIVVRVKGVSGREDGNLKSLSYTPINLRVAAGHGGVQNVLKEQADILGSFAVIPRVNHHAEDQGSTNSLNLITSHINITNNN